MQQNLPVSSTISLPNSVSTTSCTYGIHAQPNTDHVSSTCSLWHDLTHQTKAYLYGDDTDDVIITAEW